jgi:hypothetical protein
MFVITPAFKAIYESIVYKYPNTVSKSVQKPYVSAIEKSLSKEELRRYLLENKVLEKVEQGSYESFL